MFCILLHGSCYSVRVHELSMLSLPVLPLARLSAIAVLQTDFWLIEDRGRSQKKTVNDERAWNIFDEIVLIRGTSRAQSNV